MRSWWGRGAGFRIALVEAVDILPDVVHICSAVVAAVVGIACASPLLGSRPLPTNFSYCWSHGYAVSAQHNSISFINCAMGHQSNSTRQNTMGGIQDRAHRINL